MLSYGRDPRDGRWCCPLLEAWGVSAHQKFTPAARRRLAFTASASGTYAEAAELATEWGLPVADATLHALVRSGGARAEEQTLRRLETPAAEREPERAPSALAVLRLDGCLLRFRGPGWGQAHPKEPRAEWHELKLGVFYREEHAAQTAGGRGLLREKRLVSWRGEAGELGRRLHWEARADGLGRALSGRWAWPCTAKATPPPRRGWFRAAKKLRRGHAAKLLQELKALAPPAGEAGDRVWREQNYFEQHAARMNYRELARNGPIGSGAVESACRQRQCRFKRAGQFWTPAGLRHLCALQEARRNRHWEEPWAVPPAHGA